MRFYWDSIEIGVLNSIVILIEIEILNRLGLAFAWDSDWESTWYWDCDSVGIRIAIEIGILIGMKIWPKQRYF